MEQNIKYLGSQLSELFYRLQTADRYYTSDERVEAFHIVGHLAIFNQLNYPLDQNNLTKLHNLLSVLLVKSQEDQLIFNQSFHQVFQKTEPESTEIPIPETSLWKKLESFLEEKLTVIVAMTCMLLVVGVIIKGLKPKNIDISDPIVSGVDVPGKEDLNPAGEKIKDIVVDQTGIEKIANDLNKAISGLSQAITLKEIANHFFEKQNVENKKEAQLTKTQYIKNLVRLSRIPPYQELDFSPSKSHAKQILTALFLIENPMGQLDEKKIDEVIPTLKETGVQTDREFNESLLNGDSNQISWTSFLLILLIPMSLLFLYLWYKTKRWRALLSQIFENNNFNLNKLKLPPNARETWQKQESKLQKISQCFHRRVSEPSGQIDTNKTIISTINNLGRFTPAYASKSLLPSYLFVISSAGPDDHETKRQLRMLDKIRAGDVHFERYFMEEQRNRCYQEYGESSISLSKLHHRFPNHRLVYLGTGDVFFEETHSTLADWAATEISLWKERAFLTPKSILNWGKREQVLAQLFNHVPITANITGLENITHAFEGKTQATLENFSPSLDFFRPVWEQSYHGMFNIYEPDESDWKKLWFDLNRHLDADGMTWMLACAMYPAIRWDITMYLGINLKSARSDVPVYTEERAIKISQLPWFKEGWMPNWFRKKMLNKLSEDRLDEIRNLLHEFLLGSLENNDGQNIIELEINTDGQKEKKIHDYQRENPASDQVFMDYMENKRIKPTDLTAPDKVAEKINPLKRFWEKERGYIASLIIYLLAVIIVAPKPWDGPLMSGSWFPLITLSSVLIIAPILWIINKKQKGRHS